MSGEGTIDYDPRLIIGAKPPSPVVTDTDRQMARDAIVIGWNGCKNRHRGVRRDAPDGEFWIDVYTDREPYGLIGPFESAVERDRALDDVLKMARSLGAYDVPVLKQ